MADRPFASAPRDGARLERPRVVAIVQARMGSARLPGKVLAEASGRTLLAHVVERLRAAGTLDDVWIATTDLPADDAVAAEARRLGAGVFRGSEHDVLSRFRGAAAASRAEVVVRITADCPLMDPAEVDRVTGVLLAAWPALDYVANQGPGGRRGPLGLAVEAMSREALERACREARAPYEREHVTPYLYEAAGRFGTRLTHPDVDRSHLRLTVDTPLDLAVVRAVLEALDGRLDAFAVEAAAAWLGDHPEVAGLNASVRQRDYRSAELSSRVAESEEMGSRIAVTKRPETGTLVLRADAAPDIGAGHVARCLALAEAWCALGGRAVLVGAGAPEPLAAGFRALGAAPRQLPSRPKAGSEADARETAAAALEIGAAGVVADGYAFDRGYLAGLSGQGFFTAYVDDAILADLPVDVIVNPNAGARPQDYGAAAGSRRVLAGAPYALLRRAFAEAARPERTFAPPLRLLVTFGGSDPARLTPRVLQAALAVAAELPLHIGVLAGPMQPLHELRAAEERARAQEGAVRLVAGERDMPRLFAGADLAVAAAGVTAWELACSGVPMLLAAVAENQLAVLRPLVAAGAARSLGDPPGAVPRVLRQLEDKALVDGLRDFVRAGPDVHRAMSEAGVRLVDGRGAERVARVLASRAGSAAGGREGGALGEEGQS